MFLFASVFALISFLFFVPPATARAAEKEGASGQIEIKAPPSVVWDAVHRERASDPDLCYSKVVEEKGDKILLEQKFHGMPIIGEAVCLLEQTETANKRIDYKLVHSNKFKALRGSWILTELPDGITRLELHSVLNTGLPFSEKIINSVLKGRINKRLERVKASAERIIADVEVKTIPVGAIPSFAR